MIQAIKNFISKKKPAPVMKRGFAGADVGRLYSSWTTTNQSADTAIRPALKVLRARSRDLESNNDHIQRFLSLLRTNVVGDAGIILQSKVVEMDGVTLDEGANKKIEAAWAKWCKKQNCTVTGQLNFIDVLNLTVTSAARDGEFLIRRVKGYDNPFRYALQLFEGDYLDEELNEDRMANGNKTRMGVERNAWGRPMAYHLFASHPGDDSYYTSPFGRKYVRIPAEEMSHVYIKRRTEQTRGIPWAAAPMTRLNMLGGYEEAELVAARMGAAKMGIITSPAADGYTGDDKDAQGNDIVEVEPGMFMKLKQGQEFTDFDPTHPSGTFDGFVKAILRGIAAGLNVSYHSLAMDLSSVNFSSIRQGTLEDRDVWKMLQGWLIREVLEDLFSEWLSMAILSGQVVLPAVKIEKFNRPQWAAKRWPWVDPLKDQQANTEAIGQCLKTRTMVCAEQGIDWEEDVVPQLKREREILKQNGLEVAAPTAAGAFGKPKDDPKDGPDDPKDEEA